MPNCFFEGDRGRQHLADIWLDAWERATLCPAGNRGCYRLSIDHLAQNEPRVRARAAEVNEADPATEPDEASECVRLKHSQGVPSPGLANVQQPFTCPAGLPLWFYSTFHMARRPAMVCTNTHTALYFSRAVMNAQRYTLALARARIHRITIIMDDSAALRLHLLPDVRCQRRKKSALYTTTWKPEVWREAYCGCLHYSSGNFFKKKTLPRLTVPCRSN